MGEASFKGAVAVVTFSGATCIRETAKAILVVHEDFPEDMWFPKSHVHDDSEVYSMDDEGDLVVTEWIADQKGVA